MSVAGGRWCERAFSKPNQMCCQGRKCCSVLLQIGHMADILQACEYTYTHAAVAECKFCFSSCTHPEPGRLHHRNLHTPLHIRCSLQQCLHSPTENTPSRHILMKILTTKQLLPAGRSQSECLTQRPRQPACRQQRNTSKQSMTNKQHTFVEAWASGIIMVVHTNTLALPKWRAAGTKLKLKLIVNDVGIPPRPA